jgi:threonine/homoserine/homoserine lactone efflux protein
MIDLATLSLFLVAALALFLSPADLVHTLCAATGVTALVAAWPPAFDLLRYAGALYLLWLAWQALRSGDARLQARADGAGFARVLRMAWLNNLVNPKALLFFMVFLPQFVDPARGSVPMQLVMLGVTLSLAGLVFNTVLGACSGQIGRWLQRRRGAAGFQRGLLATVMIALAVRLLLIDRPSKGF